MTVPNDEKRWTRSLAVTDGARLPTCTRFVTGSVDGRAAAVLAFLPPILPSLAVEREIVATEMKER